MRYYRGYVRCIGKRAVDKFKGVPDEGLRTLEQAQTFDSYAGVLAPGIVLVDFDIAEHSEIAYKIVKELGLKCMIRRSEKGYHFLFRATDKVSGSRSRLRLACGILADFKVGTKNSYEVLKNDGAERPIVQECDNPDEIPAFLTPVESEVDFLTMGDGDGRNSKLYGYLLTLKRHRFTPNESRATIDVINRFVFKEPLPQNEIETICRDEAFVPDKPLFVDDKGRFLHSVFAQYLVDTLNIIKIDGALHVYKDGIYVRGTKRIEQEMIKHMDNLTINKRTETYRYLDLLIDEDHEMADARYIAFNNGIYDIVTDQLLPFTPDIILVNQIPHDYMPDASDASMLKVMNNLACGNPALFDLMCEMIGVLFWRKSEWGFSFFCLGNQSNGKSTFLDTVNFLLGNKNTSALDLKDLGKDFKSQELFGMLANIGDDISDDYISDVSVFKKVATGNIITANPKYEQPFKFRPYAKLIFSANVMPRLNDKTNAAARRIIPIPFNATFDRNSPDFDPFIRYKLQTPEAMATLINLGIAGLKRVLMDNGFTKCDEVEAEIMAIKENNNPLITFLKNRTIEHQSVGEMYNDYTWWASNSGVNSMSKPSFIKQVETQYGMVPKVTILDGKEIAIFVKEEKH